MNIIPSKSPLQSLIFLYTLSYCKEDKQGFVKHEYTKYHRLSEMQNLIHLKILSHKTCSGNYNCFMTYMFYESFMLSKY